MTKPIQIVKSIKSINASKSSKRNQKQNQHIMSTQNERPPNHSISSAKISQDTNHYDS